MTAAALATAALFRLDVAGGQSTVALYAADRAYSQVNCQDHRS